MVGFELSTRVKAALLAILLLILTPAPTLCQPDKIWGQAVAEQMDTFMNHHEGTLDPPVICELQMPKRLWWMVLVASESAGCDPALLACVMRFESDFRCGPIGRGTYIGPMGIKRDDFERKYPIHDVFGNVLTAARRLAQFTNPSAALAGYNKDRSPAYRRYCNSVLGWSRRVRRGQILDDWAWRSAVDLGKRALVELELKAAGYASRRH